MGNDQSSGKGDGGGFDKSSSHYEKYGHHYLAHVVPDAPSGKSSSLESSNQTSRHSTSDDHNSGSLLLDNNSWGSSRDDDSSWHRSSRDDDSSWSSNRDDDSSLFNPSNIVGIKLEAGHFGPDNNGWIGDYDQSHDNDDDDEPQNLWAPPPADTPSFASVAATGNDDAAISGAAGPGFNSMSSSGFGGLNHAESDAGSRGNLDFSLPGASTTSGADTYTPWLDDFSGFNNTGSDSGRGNLHLFLPSSSTTRKKEEEADDEFWVHPPSARSSAALPDQYLTMFSSCSEDSSDYLSESSRRSTSGVLDDKKWKDYRDCPKSPVYVSGSEVSRSSDTAFPEYRGLDDPFVGDAYSQEFSYRSEGIRDPFVRDAHSQGFSYIREGKRDRLSSFEESENKRQTMHSVKEREGDQDPYDTNSASNWVDLSDMQPWTFSAPNESAADGNAKRGMSSSFESDNKRRATHSIRDREETESYNASASLQMDFGNLSLNIDDKECVGATCSWYYGKEEPSSSRKKTNLDSAESNNPWPNQQRGGGGSIFGESLQDLDQQLLGDRERMFAGLESQRSTVPESRYSSSSCGSGDLDLDVPRRNLPTMFQNVDGDDSDVFF